MSCDISRERGLLTQSGNYLNNVRSDSTVMRNFNKIELIIKYRRQGFTWDTAHKKALQEMAKPSLF